MEKIKYVCWRSFHSLKITPSNVGFKVLTAASTKIRIRAFSRVVS
jgi:hypothetical protein